jgi:glycosyltransferase involved in cell wall biosynthesis
MHIVHVITKFDVGGAQTVVRDLANMQVASGHQVTVYTGKLGPASDAAGESGATVELLHELRHEISPRTDRLALRRLTGLFGSDRPSVVHTHSSKGGLVGRWAARRAGVPSVYTAHGWPFQPGAAVAQRLSSFAGEFVGSRLGELVVCVSESERKNAIRLRVVAANNSTVIHNATMPFTRIRDDRSDALSTDPFTVVMVARFAPPKRHDLLIGALDMLPPGVGVVFVGDGPGEGAVKALAARFGSRIEFAASNDVEASLLRADAFVMVSDYEGLSISMLEAMSAGLPVVVNRLDGAAEAFEHGVQGLFVDLTPASIAAGVQRLVDDRSAAETMGANARRRWQDRFSAERMHADYLRVYGDVISGWR